MMLIPGSHRRSWLCGPPRRDITWRTPDDAVPVTAHPGDAVLFDRRMWHARSVNRSALTRKCVFFGYTYRWVRSRDDVGSLPREPWWHGLNGIQRQLLGGVGGDGDHAWGHDPDGTPLYVELRRLGLLDLRYPHLIP